MPQNPLHNYPVCLVVVATLPKGAPVTAPVTEDQANSPDYVPQVTITLSHLSLPTTPPPLPSSTPPLSSAQSLFLSYVPTLRPNNSLFSLPSPSLSPVLCPLSLVLCPLRSLGGSNGQ